jgi:hypothetical protein
MVLAGIGWTVTAVVSRPAEQSAAVRAAGNSEPSAPPPGSPSPAASSPPETAEPNAPLPDLLPDPRLVARQASAAGRGFQDLTGPPPSPQTAVTAELLLQDETPRGPTPPPTPVQVPPTGPVPCTNAMLGVAAEVEPVRHRVGEQPLLRLVVTNVGDQPCIRDLDPARQEVVVWSGGGQRLWSSNDCSPVARSDLRTLVPGRSLVFSVRWSGRASQPGCPQPRAVVPAGSYTVLTRVDDVISAPAPLERTP